MRKWIYSIWFFLCVACCLEGSELRWFTLPTTISTTPSTSVALSVNNAGQAVALWSGPPSSGSTQRQVYAATFNPNIGWSDPIALSIASQNTEVFGTSVAINNSGQIIAMWTARKKVDSKYYLQYSTATFGGAWSSEHTVDTAPGQTSSLIEGTLALNNQGNVIAGWNQVSGATTSIHTSQLTFGGGWTNTQLLATASTIYPPKVALNDNSQMVITWEDDPDVKFASGTFGGSFSSSSDIVSGGATLGITPRIAMNNSGQILVSYGLDSHIYAATSTFGSTPSPVDVGAYTGVTSGNIWPSINGSGQMLIVWDETGVMDYIKAATQTFGSGSWLVQNVTTSTIYDLSYPVGFLDSRGNTVVLWLSESGGGGTLRNVQASNAEDGGSWSTPTILSSQSKDANFPVVTGNNNSLVLVGWLNVTDSSVQTLFGLFYPDPPTHLRGQQRQNRSLTQVEYYNHLDWNPSPSKFVFYNIYKNNTLIGTAEGTHFDDRYQKKKKQQTYSVSAIDFLGLESTRVTVTVP